jgi:hypothetical protein
MDQDTRIFSFSAKGHVRFTPNSDTKSRHAHVCFTPESGHVQCAGSFLLWANSGLMQRSKDGSLFDHFVGNLLNLPRNLKAERFRGLEIDH